VSSSIIGVDPQEVRGQDPHPKRIPRVGTLTSMTTQSFCLLCSSVHIIMWYICLFQPSLTPILSYYWVRWSILFGTYAWTPKINKKIKHKNLANDGRYTIAHW